MDVVGMEREYQLAKAALSKKQPVLLYGFTGNGKTLLAWKLASEVKQANPNTPIIYLQLYPEMTKNSLIGGETIKNGSIVVEEQALLKFGTKPEGAIFIVDECTHTTEPVLLSFNSLIEDPFSTVVGDKIYKLSENTRFIFCGNLPDHAGNINLPISFANRLFIVKTEMPSKENLCKIGKMANTETPDELLDFVAKIILETYEAAFPISPRNIVTFSKTLDAIYKTGYKANKTLPKTIERACKQNDINLDLLKQIIMSSLMAYVSVKTQGPDKVKAMLWD
jgi:MoxR-like ATPase